MTAGPVLADRFHVEARCSLPVPDGPSQDVAAVFSGMRVKRGVIHFDIALAEWDG